MHFVRRGSQEMSLRIVCSDSVLALHKERVVEKGTSVVETLKCETTEALTVCKPPEASLTRRPGRSLDRHNQSAVNRRD
jgi:hypothetical protein